MYYDSISMKLQERQNHSDKADQQLPREEGRACKGALFGVGELFCNLTVGVVMGLLTKVIKLDS